MKKSRFAITLATFATCMGAVAFVGESPALATTYTGRQCTQFSFGKLCLDQDVYQGILRGQFTANEGHAETGNGILYDYSSGQHKSCGSATTDAGATNTCYFGTIGDTDEVGVTYTPKGGTPQQGPQEEFA